MKISLFDLARAVGNAQMSVQVIEGETMLFGISCGLFEPIVLSGNAGEIMERLKDKLEPYLEGVKGSTLQKADTKLPKPVAEPPKPPAKAKGKAKPAAPPPLPGGVPQDTTITQLELQF